MKTSYIYLLCAVLLVLAWLNVYLRKSSQSFPVDAAPKELQALKEQLQMLRRESREVDDWARLGVRQKEFEEWQENQKKPKTGLHCEENCKVQLHDCSAWMEQYEGRLELILRSLI